MNELWNELELNIKDIKIKLENSQKRSNLIFFFHMTLWYCPIVFGTDETTKDNNVSDQCISFALAGNVKIAKEK